MSQDVTSVFLHKILFNKMYSIHYLPWLQTPGTLSKIFPALEKVKVMMQNAPIDKETKHVLLRDLHARWDMLHTAAHGAAFAADTEFVSHQLPVQAMTDFEVMAARLLPPDGCSKAVAQLAMFRERRWVFSRPATWEAARCMPGFSWWKLYGADTPELQYMAVRLLSQVTSSSSCERNWSDYSYIVNKRRNRLGAKRAEKLVYVFSNARLVDKEQSVGKETEFVAWGSDEEDVPSDEDVSEWEEM